MALNLKKNLKLYYSIKEVAEMFDLNESTLRYWEQEFPFLKPKTSGPSKVRQYQEKDIEQIRLIHNLLKVRVMRRQEQVPAGAKKANKHYKPWEETNTEVVLTNTNLTNLTNNEAPKDSCNSCVPAVASEQSSSEIFPQNEQINTR